MWQVAVAVIGAWCVAIGAAAQEQPATAAGGRAVARWGLIRQLIVNPRWIAGAAVTAIGMILHLIALTSAPLTVIQPLGISGLLVGVWIAARWRRRKITGHELLSAVAVTVGLSGLVLFLPTGSTHPPTMADPALLLLATTATALAIAVMIVAPRIAARPRAWLLAATAGMCFGITAALVRVIANDLAADLSAIWHWRVIAAAVLISLGGVLLQDAYRAGHFALSYATLLIADPVIAAFVGVALVGEPLPDTWWAGTGAIAAAALTVAGVVGLSRSARAPTATRPPPTREPRRGSGHLAQSTKENNDVSANAHYARS